MLTPNPSWNLWIHRSAATFFKDIADTNSIAFYIRGVYDKSEQNKEFIEYHTGDLKVTQVSRGYFKIEVPISVAYSVDLSSNVQRDKQIAGLLLESFDNICVYKYGDDDSYVGSMLPSEVSILDLGQKDQIQQGFVETVYEVYLTQ